MKRGAILWINLSGATPPEFNKTRPGVIVSNSEQNAILETVVAIPLSTQAPEIWPLRLKIPLPGRKTSYAIIPGIRQVNKNRLLDTIGVVEVAFLRELDRALAAYLGD